MKHTGRSIFTLAFILLFHLSFRVAAEDSAGPRIMPEDYLRSWDPITLVFDSDIGPVRGGPADDPGALFRLRPSHPGEYRWVDGRTLQFLPAAPWPPLEKIRVSSGTREMVLRTLMAPPVRVSPRNGSENLDPLSRVELVLPTWVNPLRLKNLIEITARPLPGLSGQAVRRIGGDSLSVHVADPRPGSPEVTVSVELAEPVGYGMKIDLALRLGEEADAEAYVARYRFSTRPVFRLTDMGSGNYRLPVGESGSVYSLDRVVSIRRQDTPLFLQFSERLDSLSMEEVRRIVRFSPSVRNFNYDVVNNRLYIYVDADAEVPYRMLVNHEPILSGSGRVLAPFGPSGFSFFFEKHQPYLRWDRGDAVVERYGPKMFPMEGRGVSRVDLRIYSIDPLDRRFWPFGSGILSVDEEARPPMPGEPINTRERALRSLGSPDVSSIIPLPIEETSPSTSFGLDLAPRLEEIHGPEAPGTYLVGYRALGSDSNRHYVRTVVTDLDLSVVEEEHGVVFFVTSLADGSPVKGAEIRIEGQDDNEEEYITVIRGVTDETGMFRYEHRKALEHPLRRIIVSLGKDVITFDPSNPPPSFRNNHWFGSSTRWLSWLNRDPVTRREAPVYRGYILSERPIYRPDEAVHLLGYVRMRKTGEIAEDTRDVERRVDVTGPGGRTWTYAVETDEYGQFTLDFNEADVPTGYYTARLYDDSGAGTVADVRFQIESYRVPRFEVQIHGEDRVPVDEPFSLELTAEYYAGGRVSGRPVFWRVTESSFFPRPVGFEGFTFSSYESIGGGYSGRSSGLTRQNETDENGLAVLAVDPSARKNPTAVRYLVEGTVEGADGQRVTAVKSVQALPPFSVGIRQDRFVRNIQKLEPEVVVVDFDGEVAAGKDYTLRIYQRQWHSYLAESDFVTGEAEYRSEVVDELVLEEDHTSKEEPTKFSYPVEESGVYIIELLARDEMGRLQTVRVDCYVPGTSPVAWERTEGNVFETTADKDSYEPGDVARVLIQSPFQEASALAVVEGPLAVEYTWIDITGGQAVFEIPIHARMVPRLPVHFLLVRGRVPGTEDAYTPSFDRGRPVSMANTTFLTVLPVDHELRLDLDYPVKNLPGSTVTVEIAMTDSDGYPADGQVALWLVDRAVLSLAEERKADPLEAFIDPVHSSLTIRDTRNQVVGNLPFRENPGGGGWAESMAREADLLDRTTVRRNFMTVPYYNPRIRVKGGKARVEIELPDNLTDFAIRAVAVSGYSRFGTASGLLSIRLPVIVQTALPRFVRPGDEFSAGGVARIVEGPGGRAEIQVRTEGMEIADGGHERTRTDILEKGVASKQYFDFTVPRGGTGESVSLTLGVSRLSDGVSDAFEAELPLRTGTFDEHRIKVVRPGAGMEESFPVEDPFERGTLRQCMTVAEDQDMLHLLASLTFLDERKPETTEQWTGRFRTAFRMKELLDAAGREKDLRITQRGWEEFLEYLDTVRTTSGLYSQFPGGRGLVSLTAWVLDAMELAETAGLKTDTAVFDRTVRSLQDALRSDYRYLVSDYSFQERAEALYALGRAGYFDESYGRSLLTAARGNNLYAAALLAICYAEQDKARLERVRDLVDYLKEAAVFRLEGGEKLFTGLAYRERYWGGYLMTSRTRTVAAVIRAMAMIDPADDDIRPMTDYLLRQGTGRGWGSTADTMEAVTTLEYLQGLTEPGRPANRRFTLQFGSEQLVLDTGGRAAAGLCTDIQVPGTVARTRGGGEDPWLYLEAVYRPTTPASEIEARNEGFVVNRELQIVEDGRVIDRIELQRRPVEMGVDTLVEEHITISNPEERYYVALHVPLAAGCEPLNPELETSGADARPLGGMTLAPTCARYLDDEVVYYYEKLPKGTYHFYFRERAVFEGAFQLPPARAEALYEQDVRGNSPGALLKIAGE